MLRARPPRALLFDLDGTLVDSVPDIAVAVDATLADLGRDPAGVAAVRDWVGNGVVRLLHRALTGQMDADADGALLERAHALFLQHYARSNGTASRVYDGVHECLQAVAGHARLGCVTNKPARFAADLLDALGLASCFEVLLGGDSLPRAKPDPLPLRHAAATLGVPLDATCMIGDSVSDVRAARAAPCTVICVSYGYNHGHDIGESRPDAVVDSLAELPALLFPAAAVPVAGRRC